jgi:outer membrane protein TolC
MNRTLYIFILITLTYTGIAQEPAEKMNLTLNDVIRIAREQSYDALIARHTLRGSYWQYRTHKAGLLPNLDLNSNLLNYRNAISKVETTQGEQFYYQDQNSSDVSLQLTQAIPMTGGSLFVRSNLERLDDFLEDSTALKSEYSSSPIVIGYRQPLFSFNSLKWEKKIEPVRYEEARKKYLETMEQVSIRAISNFFDLALAQINLEIAQTNYNNNDTLYKIAQGRFKIGTIAQNDLMQMELNFLSSKAELEQSKLDLEIKEFQLVSFLGFNNKVSIELTIPENTPNATITYDQVLYHANLNNPQILQFERRTMEAEREVSRARSESRFQADLYASYGLTDQDYNLSETYRGLDNSLMVNVGVTIPIIDWGQGKGLVKIARSNQEVIHASVNQSKIEFEQNIYLLVREFNIQNDQFTISAKADTIAHNKYEVTKQRFLIGKIDVLDLNVALTEKDSKRRAYVATLRNYWNNYYNLRKLTLFDFEANHPLEADYDLLVR